MEVQYYNAFVDGIGIVNKLKLTFSNGSTNGIYVGRIYAQDSYQYGQTWLSKNGGNLLNDLSFSFNTNGVMLKDRSNGNNYRL